MRGMSAIVVLCTCPDADVGGRIAAALVDECLAACVSCVPGLSTIYRWKGAVHRDAEVLLLIKTTRDRFDALKSRLATLHSHDVPELIAFDVVDGLAPWLDWVVAETRPR